MKKVKTAVCVGKGGGVEKYSIAYISNLSLLLDLEPYKKFGLVGWV